MFDFDIDCYCCVSFVVLGSVCVLSCVVVVAVVVDAVVSVDLFPANVLSTWPLVVV